MCQVDKGKKSRAMDQELRNFVEVHRKDKD